MGADTEAISVEAPSELQNHVKSFHAKAAKSMRTESESDTNKPEKATDMKLLAGGDTEQVPVMKDGWEYDEMEDDDATNGEGRNTEENADDDKKGGDTEDDRKTTITAGGRKDKGSGNEVKASSGQEDPRKQKTDKGSELKEEEVTKEAVAKKNNTEEEDDDTDYDGMKDGSLDTTGNEVPGGQEDPRKQKMEYEKSENEEEKAAEVEAAKKNKKEEEPEEKEATGAEVEKKKAQNRKKKDKKKNKKKKKQQQEEGEEDNTESEIDMKEGSKLREEEMIQELEKTKSGEQILQEVQVGLANLETEIEDVQWTIDNSSGATLKEAHEEMVRLQQLLKEKEKTMTAVKLRIKYEIRDLKVNITTGFET